MLACYAIKSKKKRSFYVRYEYGDAYRSLRSAIDELYAAKLLGTNIFRLGVRPSTSCCIAGPGRTSAARKRG